MKKAKQLISFILLFVLICSIESTAVAVSSTMIQSDSEVEFILVPSKTRGTESLFYDCDGGRKKYYDPLENDYLLEYVWGWSTCVDTLQKDVYHYTVAQYEDFFGTVPAWTSGRIWGVGKVYAYSPYISANDLAPQLKARVYYGSEA